MTLDSPTRVYTINTADLAVIGTYTVTTTCMTHNGSDSGVSFDFQIDVQQDPCLLATLTIDPSTLTSNPYTYVIDDPADVQTFNDSAVSSSETVHPCPTDFEFTIMNRDGSAFDTNLFTWDSAA